MERTELQKISARVSIRRYDEAHDVPFDLALQVAQDAFGVEEVSKWVKNEYIVQLAASETARKHAQRDAFTLLSLVQDRHLDELREVRVRMDHKVYVHGTIDMMVRAAWSDGYQYGIDDMEKP